MNIIIWFYKLEYFIHIFVQDYEEVEVDEDIGKVKLVKLVLKKHIKAKGIYII